MTGNKFEFDVGDMIVEDPDFRPSFEGVGKVEGPEHEIKRRLVDTDSGEGLYWTEWEEADQTHTSLKSAKMVHMNYIEVDQ